MAPEVTMAEQFPLKFIEKQAVATLTWAVISHITLSFVTRWVTYIIRIRYTLQKETCQA